MAITNTSIVNTTEKYIVQSKGIGGEKEQIMADAEKLESGNNESKISLIECYYQNCSFYAYKYKKKHKFSPKILCRF